MDMPAMSRHTWQSQQCAISFIVTFVYHKPSGEGVRGPTLNFRNNFYGWTIPSYVLQMQIGGWAIPLLDWRNEGMLASKSTVIAKSNFPFASARVFVRTRKVYLVLVFELCTNVWLSGNATQFPNTCAKLPAQVKQLRVHAFVFVYSSAHISHVHNALP